MPDQIEIDAFRPQLGSVFKLQNGSDEGHDLELIEVRDLTLEDKNRDPNLRSIPFRLTFRSAVKDGYFEQQILRLTHDELGELDIFLVPLGPDSEGTLYEAIFN